MRRLSFNPKIVLVSYLETLWIKFVTYFDFFSPRATTVSCPLLIVSFLYRFDKFYQFHLFVSLFFHPPFFHVYRFFFQKRYLKCLKWVIWLDISRWPDWLYTSPTLDWVICLTFVVHFYDVYLIIRMVPFIVRYDVRWHVCAAQFTQQCIGHTWFLQVVSSREKKSLFQNLSFYNDKTQFFACVFRYQIWYKFQ